MRQILSREDQRRWAGVALNRQLPANGGFHLIARAPGAEVRRQAQAGELFNRLVRRPIFAKPDGVVGINHNLPRLHQRRHTRRVAGILDKHQEGGGIRHKSAVMGETIGNRRHPELTHAVVDVVPGDILFERFRAGPDSQVTRGQIRRAAEQFRQDGADHVEGILRGFTGGDFRRIGL
ncbi:hypothetical protein D3C72_1023120 [compost metagenome]